MCKVAKKHAKSIRFIEKQVVFLIRSSSLFRHSWRRKLSSKVSRKTKPFRITQKIEIARIEKWINGKRYEKNIIGFNNFQINQEKWWEWFSLSSASFFPSGIDCFFEVQTFFSVCVIVLSMHLQLLSSYCCWFLDGTPWEVINAFNYPHEKSISK